MAVRNFDKRLMKMEKRAKALDATNPKLAANLRGKIAGLKGKQ